MNTVVSLKAREGDFLFLAINQRIDLVYLKNTKTIVLNIFNKDGDQIDQISGDDKITDFCIDCDYLKDYVEFKDYIKNYEKVS